jgi:hypothetical protein
VCVCVCVCVCVGGGGVESDDMECVCWGGRCWANVGGVLGSVGEGGVQQYCVGSTKIMLSATSSSAVDIQCHSHTPHTLLICPLPAAFSLMSPSLCILPM